MEKALIQKLIYETDCLEKNGILDGKMLVLGPVNVYMRTLINRLEKKNYQISFVIDNNTALQGNCLSGKSIVAVEEIRHYDPQKIKILLISQYFFEIRDQLCRIGVNTADIIQVIETPQKKEATNAIALSDKVRNAWEMAQRGKRLFYRIKNEDCVGEKVALFPYNSLGDVFILGLFKTALYEVYGDNVRLILVGNGCVQVAKWFGYETYKVSEDEKESLLQYVASVRENSIPILHFRYWHTGILDRIAFFHGFDFVELYSSAVFQGRKLELQLGKSITETVIQKVKKNQCEACGVVILSPYAKSLPELTPLFWEMLADRLGRLGFSVYSNCANDFEIEVYGTERLEIGLDDLMYLLDQNEKSCFIGLRSGLCDVIGFTKGKKLVIYPDENSKVFYSLKYLHNSYIDEFVFMNDEAFLEKIIKKVKEILE